MWDSKAIEITYVLKNGDQLIYSRVPSSLLFFEVCVPKTSNPTIVVMKSAKDGA
jgi:hypothetical protein